PRSTPTGACPTIACARAPEVRDALARARTPAAPRLRRAGARRRTSPMGCAESFAQPCDDVVELGVGELPAKRRHLAFAVENRGAQVRVVEVRHARREGGAPLRAGAGAVVAFEALHVGLRVAVEHELAGSLCLRARDLFALAAARERDEDPW